MTIAEREVGRVWRRVLLRTLVATACSVAVAAYVFLLVQRLDPAQRTRAALVGLPLAFLAAALQFSVISWLLVREALCAPDQPAGTRLVRLLKLPRRIELLASTSSWLTASVVFGAVMAFGFDRGWGAMPAVLVVGFFSSLAPGMLVVSGLQADLLPLALEESRRTTSAWPRLGGPFWPRQAWYLPYVFSAAVLSVLGLAGMVLQAAFRAATDKLIDVMTGILSASEEMAAMVRTQIASLATAAGLQVLVIALVLLVLFAVSGWAMAQRQARAARTVEASLRALAGGAPELPVWVATDEIGDLAAVAAGISGEMQQAFAQLKAMAGGDLGQELPGDSGLLAAFRRSRDGMLELVRRMSALSRGEVVAGGTIPGDLGAAFERLRGSLDATVVQARTISDGDLRHDADVPGELGASLQRMTANLRAMVSNTQAASARVGDIVVSLQSAAAQLSAATTEQVAAVTETANTMTEMAQTSSISAERAGELIRQGESAAAVVEEGGDSSSKAVTAMNALAGALRGVTAESTALGERVRHIDEVTEKVTFLADQSSTLAINAAIEAARAGEAGRGFSVVAREIRSLAADSRKAAAQIREMLDAIREQKVRLDGSVATGQSTADEGCRLVQRIGEVIAQLGITVGDAVGLMRQVEGSARQHQIGVGQVTQALSSIQKASESIRDGARLLGELSGEAHGMSADLQEAAGAYTLR